MDGTLTFMMTDTPLTLDEMMEKNDKIRLIISMCDHEIAPVVRDLMEGGIETFSSCQSGPGHSFARPIVRISAKHTRDKIQRVLQKAGYTGYYISGWWSSHGDTMKLMFWEVQFWANNVKPGVHLTYANWHAPDEVQSLKYNLYRAMIEYERLENAENSNS